MDEQMARVGARRSALSLFHCGDDRFDGAAAVAMYQNLSASRVHTEFNSEF